MDNVKIFKLEIKKFKSILWELYIVYWLELLRSSALLKNALFNILITGKNVDVFISVFNFWNVTFIKRLSM